MNAKATKPVLIVGAGMAGLACAVQLHRAGRAVRVFEASDGVGGRVRTDVLDGFLLDRGFQVFLDTYPQTRRLLDLEALDLKAFEPGALIYRGGRLHRLMDVFRRPASAWSSLTAPVGSLSDKLRVGLLRMKLLNSSFEAIAAREDRTTESYLREFGFSETIIDRFFRAFYGGIFLERELSTSSRMFEFTFKLFGRGSATVPARGMGEIPKQLASRLPHGTIQLNQAVKTVGIDSITLKSGERIQGCATVVATDGDAAHALLPGLQLPKSEWRSVTNLYFSADRSPIHEAILCLNGSGEGLINNVCVLSDAAPSYAPEGQSLLSVSVLGLPDDHQLVDKVRTELAAWFGPDAASWRHLRTDRIRRALPQQPPDATAPLSTNEAGVWLSGDYLSSASIEGAVLSGQHTAAAILAHCGTQ
jgi:phytoene dehydrogenase-like protein